MNTIFDMLAGWKLGDEINLLNDPVARRYTPTDVASRRILRFFGLTCGVPVSHYERFIEVAEEMGYGVNTAAELLVERDDADLNERLAKALIQLTEELQAKQPIENPGNPCDAAEAASPTTALPMEMDIFRVS